jgi:hypothetical protein
MATIQAQKVPVKKINTEDILCVLCYHYPQYTYQDAQQLPYKRIKKLIQVARSEQAINWYNLLMIATAPHAKKGTVKSMADKYKKIIEEATI